MSHPRRVVQGFLPSTQTCLPRRQSQQGHAPVLSTRRQRRPQYMEGQARGQWHRRQPSASSTISQSVCWLNPWQVATSLSSSQSSLSEGSQAFGGAARPHMMARDMATNTVASHFEAMFEDVECDCGVTGTSVVLCLGCRIYRSIGESPGYRIEEASPFGCASERLPAAHKCIHQQQC